MTHKLKDNEQLYSTTLKCLNDAVIITNIDRQITFINPAGEALTGWANEEAHGKDTSDVIELINKTTQYSSNLSPIRLLWDCVTRGLSVGISNDLILRAKDGRETNIEHSGSLIRNSNGDMIGVVFLFRNITEKKQMEDLKESMYEQQLIQADKMKSLGTLVSGIAHEINNPNNFIMLNTPMLQDVWKDVMPILERYYQENGDFKIGGLDFTEMRNYIPQLFSGICDGSNRIKRIVSDLKNFARENPADMNQLIDINFVVKSAITLISNQIKKATKNFSVNYGNDLPNVKGNSQRLEQVIINLILNACQALKNPKKSISVLTYYNVSDHFVMVEIRDEGIGIPSDIIPRILDPFFTTKRDIGGTGLGLSVSSGIIKDHGGELNFTSDKGKGTTVTLNLPVQNEI